MVVAYVGHHYRMGHGAIRNGLFLGLGGKAMTKLREITENLNALYRHEWDQRDKDIAFLLNFAVEEKAKYICSAQHGSSWVNVDCRDQWRTEALLELDLEGVWPVKEKG